MTKRDEFNKKQLASGKLTVPMVSELVEYWQTGHGLQVDGMAGDRETIPSIQFALSDESPPKESTARLGLRGIVVKLTREQIVTRAMYLAGRARLEDLDQHVRKEDAPSECPTIYYLLKGHNGGKDPTASDPSDRWSNPGSTFVNVTCDCSGGNAWMHGFDRFQPKRFSHIYDGWINTDSKMMDASGPQKCFRSVGRPEPGTIIVYKTHKRNGKTIIGHEGTVVGYRGDLSKWDPKVRKNWSLIDVVDVSARGAGQRANLLRDGSWWYGVDSMFLESVMVP